MKSWTALKKMHLVLLDNGRSQAYAEDQMRRTLQCIRCGACMNHCPVYTRIGGAAYGTTYPGPIGEISLRICWAWMRHAICRLRVPCVAPVLRFVRYAFRLPNKCNVCVLKRNVRRPKSYRILSVVKAHRILRRTNGVAYV